MKKKIWICGSSGMLGSHFIRLMEDEGLEFVATRSSQIDITDLEKVSDFVRIQKITHIINCAAYTNVDKAEEELKQAYLVNAIGPHNLGIAGRRHGANVIHFSTDYVVDGKGRTPYTEDHYCTPINAYGMSKLAGEIKLLDEHERSCIIRTSWLFGFPGKNFVERMLHLMREREQLRIVNDQVGRPTYCQDLAEATLELLDEEGIYHFANAFETTWFKFAVEIHRQAKELGFSLAVKTIEPIASHEYPTIAKRPSYSTLNTKKVEEYLGCVPRSWQEALGDYLSHIKKVQNTNELLHV